MKSLAIKSMILICIFIFVVFSINISGSKTNTNLTLNTPVRGTLTASSATDIYYFSIPKPAAFTFNLSADEPSVFLCSLDGAPFASCSALSKSFFIRPAMWILKIRKKTLHNKPMPNWWCIVTIKRYITITSFRHSKIQYKIH